MHSFDPVRLGLAVHRALTRTCSAVRAGMTSSDALLCQSARCSRPPGRWEEFLPAAYRDCRHVRPMQTQRCYLVHCKENLSLWSPWWSLWWLFVVIVVVLQSPWSSRRNGRR